MKRTPLSKPLPVSVIRRAVLAKIFETLRDESGLSVAELAELARVSPGTVLRVERGGFEYAPRLDTVVRLALANGIRTSQLLSWYEDSTSDLARFGFRETADVTGRAVVTAAAEGIVTRHARKLLPTRAPTAA